VEANPSLPRGAVQIFIPGRVPAGPGESVEWTGDADFLLLCNPGEFDTVFSLPPGARSRSWWKVVDTAMTASVSAPFERASGAVTCRAHSMIVLMGCERAFPG
jgi:hypothetical protein